MNKELRYMACQVKGLCRGLMEKRKEEDYFAVEIRCDRYLVSSHATVHCLKEKPMCKMLFPVVG